MINLRGNLELHFLYEPGYDPIAMNLLKTRVQEVCDKPDGVIINAKEGNFDNDNTWTASMLETLDGNMAMMR